MKRNNNISNRYILKPENKSQNYSAYDITKKIGGVGGIPPQNSGFGGYRALDFHHFLTKCSEKKSHNLEQKLSSEKIHMVIEDSTASEWNIEKKVL